MQNFLFPIFLLSVALTGSPYAQDLFEDDEIDDLEFLLYSDPVSEVVYNDQPMNGMTTNSTPAQFPKNRMPFDTHNIYLSGEPLCWRVQEGELNYVIPRQKNTLANPSGAAGTLKSQEFNWNAGVRVGAGIAITPDFWDLEAKYTYYHVNTSTSAHASSSHLMLGTFIEFTGSSLRTAPSHISFLYQVADLTLGKRFALSPRLIMKLFCGGIGGWINQDWKAMYVALSGGTSEKIRNQWSFHGGGLQLGWDWDWLIGSGFSLLAEMRGGLLFGAYHNHQRMSNNSFSFSAPFVNTKLDEHRIVSTVLLSLGPSWGLTFPQWGFNIFAGYELNMWFNLHELISSSQTNTANFIADRLSMHASSPVALQGFTGKLQFNF